MKYGADVNIGEQHGYSPLHLASQKGFESMTEFLITNHANINQRDNRGYSPVNFTLMNCDIMKPQDRLVEFLLAHGDDVNNDNQSGCTPVMTAVIL